MARGFFDIIFGLNQPTPDPDPKEKRKEKVIPFSNKNEFDSKISTMMSSLSETVGEPEDGQDAE